MGFGAKLAELERAQECRSGVRIGRAMLGTLFLISGVLKATQFAGVSTKLAAMGLPMTPLLTALVIAAEVGGGSALVLGWKARWAAAMLAVFVVPATFLFHAFWHADAASYSNQLNHFLKNVGLCGALLFMASIRPTGSHATR